MNKEKVIVRDTRCFTTILIRIARLDNGYRFDCDHFKVLGRFPILARVVAGGKSGCMHPLTRKLLFALSPFAEPTFQNGALDVGQETRHVSEIPFESSSPGES